MSKLTYYFQMAQRINYLKATPKIINYLKYKISKRLEITDLKQYSPQIASLIITKRCNMACNFCSAGKIMEEGRDAWREGELTLERTKEIFNNPLFSNALLVDLLGGEPLLVREFDDIIAYLNNRGHLTNTSTNAIKLRERIVSLKRAGISRINISYYDENREMLESDLPFINGVFPTHMSYILFHSDIVMNKEKIYEIVKFAKDSGCLSLRFFMYRPMGLEPNIGQITSEDDHDYKELKNNLSREYGKFIAWPSLVKQNLSKKLCSQPWQRIGATTVGEMLICCGTEDFLSGPKSNLFNAEPNEIYNHSTLVAMRKELISPNTPPPDLCKDCNLLNEPGW